MFVQVVQSKGGDPGAARDRMDLWVKELSAGAEGWLGSTAGYTSQGGFIAVARFESEEAARRNSDRPEQGDWWQTTEAVFSEPATFTDLPNAELFGDGGSDTAGFVQVILGRSSNVERMVELGKEMEGGPGDARPDVIGGVAGWNPDGQFAQIIYFTSEAEARENEAKPMPEEMKKTMEEWGEITEEMNYHDITEPWTWSP